MLVNRALFADRRIGFVDRFAESNAEFDRLADARFSGLEVARLDAEGAVNFAPEIEENRAALRENTRLILVAHDRRRRLAQNRL